MNPLNLSAENTNSLSENRKLYTIEDLVNLTGEPEQIILNFCSIQNLTLSAEKPIQASLYATSITEDMTNDNYFTEKGKDRIVNAFKTMKEAENVR